MYIPNPSPHPSSPLVFPHVLVRVRVRDRDITLRHPVSFLGFCLPLTPSHALEYSALSLPRGTRHDTARQPNPTPPRSLDSPARRHDRLARQETRPGRPQPECIVTQAAPNCRHQGCIATVGRADPREAHHRQRAGVAYLERRSRGEEGASNRRRGGRESRRCPGPDEEAVD